MKRERKEGDSEGMGALHRLRYLPSLHQGEGDGADIDLLCPLSYERVERLYHPQMVLGFSPFRFHRSR
jgi:hypothetical protein